MPACDEGVEMARAFLISAGEALSLVDKHDPEQLEVETLIPKLAGWQVKQVEVGGALLKRFFTKTNDGCPAGPNEKSIVTVSLVLGVQK
jgi:uncharacterized protein (DUF2249 family)